MTASNLKRRGAVYYARQVVPVDLQQAFGRRELQRSLGVRDPRTAKARLPLVLAEWHREFEQLRRRRELREGDFAMATWDHYAAELAADARERTMPAELATQREQRAPMRRHQLDALRDHLGCGETVLVHWAADAFIAQHQLLVERDSMQYRELCFRLMRGQIEALERAGERDQGNYAGKPADPLVSRPEASAEVAKPGETIRELFEQYASENPNGIADATLNQARRDIGTFIELKGESFPVSALDKKAVREWKALLLRWPVRATDVGDFKGMSFRAIIEANDKAEKPRKTITAGTVNRYLSAFGAFCGWLSAHDYIPMNPLADMHLKVDKFAKKTKVFAADQLEVLFASPMFTGCESETYWHKPGSYMIRDHRYWLPHVMMWSGARPGEIAQLLIDDVKELHGHWVMHITVEGGGDKRVKTRGSQRVVPIHSRLVEMGFLDHWRRMKEAGAARLFPEAMRNTAGQMAADFERKFSKYLTKIGLKDGRGFSLYSFRHGFADAMRRAGYLDEQFGFLMGHAKATTTGIYGQVPQGMLEQRVELIEAVCY